MIVEQKKNQMDLADSCNKFVLCLSVLRVIKNLKFDKISGVFGMKANKSWTLIIQVE